MSQGHWKRYMLGFIGKVCNIEAEEKLFQDVLILDISIDEEIIFYQKESGKGRRGFLKGYKVFCEETGKKPAFNVPVPTSQILTQ